MGAGPGLGHSSTVWDVAFNGQGTRMVSCSDDKTLMLWSCGGSTGKPHLLISLTNEDPTTRTTPHGLHGPHPDWPSAGDKLPRVCCSIYYNHLFAQLWVSELVNAVLKHYVTTIVCVYRGIGYMGRV